MNRAKAFAATGATSPFASIMIPRRDLTERDVEIEILFCGRHGPVDADDYQKMDVLEASRENRVINDK